MTPEPVPLLPLTGFTVGITAARRRDELAALLERRGARVVDGPAIRIVPVDDDAELLAVTRACLDTPPDVVVATTGIGLRGWLEAADGWGLGDRLRATLADVRLVARGPKARGVLRSAGLTEEWSPASESMSEVLEHLLTDDLSGRRIAVQLHGEPLPEFAEALTAAGAEVVPVAVYRWTQPVDVAPLRRLVTQVAARQVDALTFTSAPAVLSSLTTAAELGIEDDFLAALRADVLPVCVGPVCAAPLERRGVPVVTPDRARLGNLVRAVVEQLPVRHNQRLVVAGGRVLEVRSAAAVVDGRVVQLPPVPGALLRALAREPGRVLSRRELLTQMPGEGGDEHAVEMAVGRLRSLLGAADVVQTVVKRGYRLSCDRALVDAL